MSPKTIPQLTETTSSAASAVVAIDSGVQTYKITALNLAQGLRPLSTPPTIPVKTANFTPAVTNDGGVVRVNTLAGGFNIQLPDPSTFEGKCLHIKDVKGNLSVAPIVLLRHGSEKIEGLASSFTCEADFGEWSIYCDGTDFWML